MEFRSVIFGICETILQSYLSAAYREIEDQLISVRYITIHQDHSFTNLFHGMKKRSWIPLNYRPVVLMGKASNDRT
jgi:hypothetical protein